MFAAKATVVSLLLSVIAVLKPSAATEPQEWIVLQDKVPLVFEGNTVDVIQFGDRVSVIKDESERVLVSKNKPGWVERKFIGPPEEAVLTFSEQIKSNSKNASAYAARASSYFAAGDFNEAYSDINQAIALNKDNPSYYVLLANILARKSEVNDALKAMDTALTIDAHFVPAITCCGECLEQKGYLPGAIAMFDDAIKIAPNDWHAYLNRSILKSALNSETVTPDALSDLNAVLRINPYEKDALVLRASLLLKKERYPEVIEDSNQYLRYWPANVAVYLVRGTAFSNSGQQDAALKDCNSALQLEPECAAILYLRALAYGKIKNNAAALADIDQLLKLYPNQSELLMFRGAVHAQQQRYLETALDFGQAFVWKYPVQVARVLQPTICLCRL